MVMEFTFALEFTFSSQQHFRLRFVFAFGFVMKIESLRYFDLKTKIILLAK